MKPTPTPTADPLPLWMQKAQRRIDWGALFALWIGVLAAFSFIRHPGIARTNDSEHYVFRTADTAQAILEGRLYPRWSPHAFQGYGAPIPHFAPPLAPYAAALLQILITGDPVSAVRIVYILAIIGTSVAVYAFVTRRADAQVGLLAAALAVFSQPIALTTPYALGDLTGALAAPFAVGLWWALDRLLVTRAPFDPLLVTTFAAALWLTSPPFAAAAHAIACLLIIHEQLNRSHQLPPRVWRDVILALILGGGAAACYWLPALRDAPLMDWRAVSDVPLISISLIDFLQPIGVSDPDLLRLILTPSLGLPLLLAVLLATVWIIRHTAWRSLHLLFLLAGVTLITFTLVAQTLTLINVIALCLAIGGAGVLRWREAWRVTRSLNLPLTIALWLSFATWQPPIPSPTFGDTSPRAQIEYEQQGFGIAGLPAGAAAPTTLIASLPVPSGLESPTNSRLVVDQAGSAQIGTLRDESHADTFQAAISAPTTFQLLTAWFPGWSASIDGQPIDLIREENGLIGLTVAAPIVGELYIELDSTPSRWAAWTLLWGAVGATLFWSWRRARRSTETFTSLTLLQTGDTRAIALVLVITSILIGVAGNAASPLLRRASDGVLDNAAVQGIRTSAGLEVLPLPLASTQARVGDRLRLTMFWRTVRPLPQIYRVQAFLINLEDGSRWLLTPLRSPGAWPTPRWEPFGFLADVFHFDITDSIRTGAYAPALQVFPCRSTVCEQGERIDFFASDGRRLGETLVLPTTITVN